jgi:hypothetical protein
MIAPFSPVIDQERGDFDSASKADLADICAGRFALVKSLRAAGQTFDEDSSEEAVEGNLIHLKLFGYQIELPSVRAEKTFIMCARQRDEIVGYFTKGEVNPAELEKVWRERTFGRWQILRELRLWYRIGLAKLFSGQADLIIIDLEEACALIVDFKSGIREVPVPARNKQLRALVVLLKHNLPELVSIQCEVVQPWVTWAPRFAEYSGVSFPIAQKEIEQTFSRGLYDLKRTPGEHCGRCEARARCASAIRFASAANWLAQEVESGRVELVGGQVGDETLDRIEAAETIFKAVKARYKAELLKDPNFLPGRKITEGNRSLLSVAAAWQIVKNHVARAQFDAACSPHVTDLEDLLAGELGWRMKQKRERFNEMFADILKYGEPRMLKLSAKEKKERAAAAAAIEEPKPQLT